MSKVFISYRRRDSADVTGRVSDYLRSVLERDEVFKDVDAIDYGDDFREVIKEAIGQCSVFLAVIGDSWLNIEDNEGQKRLEQPNDPVRIEIATALASDVRVVPVLVRGATMPGPDELPEDLRPLAGKNAATVRPDPDFHSDIKRLARSLQVASRRKLYGGLIALGAVLALILAWWLLPKPPRSESAGGGISEPLSDHAALPGSIVTWSERRPDNLIRVQLDNLPPESTEVGFVRFDDVTQGMHLLEFSGKDVQSVRVGPFEVEGGTCRRGSCDQTVRYMA